MWDESWLSVHTRSCPTWWPRNTCWESKHGTIDHRTSLCISLPGNFRSCIYRVHRQKTLYWVGPCSTRTLRLSNIWLGVHSSSLELVVRGGDFELWFRPLFRPTTWEFSILIFYLFVTFTVPRETVKLGVELLPITNLMGCIIQGGRVRRADAWYAVGLNFLAALAFGK